MAIGFGKGPSPLFHLGKKKKHFPLVPRNQTGFPGFGYYGISSCTRKGLDALMTFKNPEGSTGLVTQARSLHVTRVLSPESPKAQKNVSLLERGLSGGP